MAIPLYIFYFTYLALVVVFLFFIFFNAFLLLRFGFLTLINLLVIIFFLGVSLGILAISWTYINQIDWKESVTIQAQSSFPY